MKAQRWRLISLAILFTVPVLFLVAMGSWHLWITGWWVIAWWPIVACFTLAYFMAWRWQSQQKLFKVDLTPDLHWTTRDNKAWELVKEWSQKRIDQMDTTQLGEPEFYQETAQELAAELVQIYHPGASDPWGVLTLPEFFAVMELASHEMSDLIGKNIPGAHLIRLSDWRRGELAQKWYERASNLLWVVSFFVNPSTAVRYAATQAGTSYVQKLQQSLLKLFFENCIHQLGRYLIELYSGRLQVGAERYRQLKAQLNRQESEDGEPVAHKTAADQEPPAQQSDGPRHVTITITGQVKAGKSSLVNALLGEQKATTSVLPSTATISSYDLQPEGVSDKLRLLDTVGYGHEGPTQDQLSETQTAAQQSDLIILALHAKTPARQPDLELLTKLRQWFEERPNLKMPAVLAVMTHIDLLSPQMEWDPPYDWQKPTRPKEQNIEQAVANVREQLGEFLVGAVPVCVQEGKVYGVQEELVPAITQLMDQGRAVAMLRCLHAEANEKKVVRIFDQMVSGGKMMAKVIWQHAGARK